MLRKKIAFVGRHPKFSPGSVRQDATILAAVRLRLLAAGYRCAKIAGEETGEMPVADVYVTMARGGWAMETLHKSRKNAQPLIVNSLLSVGWALNRSHQMDFLELNGIPVPPRTGTDGYWVKRGSGVTETEDDVVYAHNWEEAQAAAEAMAARGITPDVRAHVAGDLVKFYGVMGTDFFRTYYPTEDGLWKFNSERHNGRPNHFPYDEQAFRQCMEKAARLTDLDVYGGDCIVRPDGSFVLIDLNDWPSFSRCVEEAADAITARITERMEHELSEQD